MKRFWRSTRKNAAAVRPSEEANTRLIASTPGGNEKFVLSLSGGRRQEFTLSKASISIGRATANDIVLSDASVSRRHAHVERSAQGCEVVDLGSVNGVSVNGVRVARAALKPGDVFGVGDNSFRFVCDGHEPNPEMTRIDTHADLQAALLENPLTLNLEETALPRVVVLTSSATWDVHFKGDSLTIGRGAENDVIIDSDSVSRQHAVIERKNQAFIIRDLHSANGIWIRDQRVSSKVIAESDVIRIGAARLAFKAGFAPDALSAAPQTGSRAKRRRVVVVPGFGGSTLWCGSEQIWPGRTALSQLDRMHLDLPLEARGLVNEVVIVPNLIKQDQYSALTSFLKESLQYEEGKDLLEFGYDFRQDNRVSARQLAAAIDAWNVSGPLTIIAHSMGCLVTRYYLECLGGRSKAERVIFLGAPHAGTPYAFRSLLSGPNLLPLGLMNTRLRDLLATYPSWYQILPTYQFVSDQRSGFDVLTDESWVAERHRPLLRQAREFRAEMGKNCSVPSVCVFGYDIKTITGATVEREPFGVLQKASFFSTLRGDGTIPEVSSVLDGAEIHPVRQHHGSLYSDSDVKMRLKHELTRDID